jgi:hypothetical protein
VSADAVPRPRLFELLDQARLRPVVWIGAPAGAGKTALVSSYAEARGLRCVPIRADPGDPDGARAWLAGAGARDLLVLDRCELIEDAAWWRALAAAVEGAAPEARLVVMGRSAPRAEIARLVAAGAVSLLGWRDLRLSGAETAALAAAAAARFHLSLGDEDAARLHEESGGWAAGLMLALACARAEGGPVSLRSPAAARLIGAYFATEVLATLDATTRSFLIKSALVPEASGPLLDRLVGATGSGELLARLAGTGIPVDHVGGSPPRFRYCAPFRRFLQARAGEELDANEARDLRRRAAALLVEEGAVEGIDLHDLAPADDEAASLLAAQPWLAYWAAVGSLASRPEAAITWLSDALDRFAAGGDDRGYWLDWCALVQATLLACADPAALRGLVDRARLLGPDHRPFGSLEVEARVTRCLALALAAASLGSAEARAWIERAFTLPVGHDPTELALAALTFGVAGDLDPLAELVGAWVRRTERAEIGPGARLGTAIAQAVLRISRGRAAGGPGGGPAGAGAGRRPRGAGREDRRAAPGGLRARLAGRSAGAGAGARRAGRRGGRR